LAASALSIQVIRKEHIVSRQINSRRFARSFAVALTVTAIAAPAAAARPIGETHPIGIESGSAPAAPTVITTTERGFDWGSAGLGAGAAGAIVLLSFAGFSFKSHAHVRPVS
jgi:hypothetical protein